MTLFCFAHIRVRRIVAVGRPIALRLRGSLVRPWIVTFGVNERLRLVSVRGFWRFEPGDEESEAVEVAASEES